MDSGPILQRATGRCIGVAPTESPPLEGSQVVWQLWLVKIAWKIILRWGHKDHPSPSRHGEIDEEYRDLLEQRRAWLERHVKTYGLQQSTWFQVLLKRVRHYDSLLGHNWMRFERE